MQLGGHSISVQNKLLLGIPWWSSSSDSALSLPQKSAPSVVSNSATPMDCSPPGFSVRGILWARILEWVAISSYRGSSRPRDLTRIFCVSCIGRQILYHCATFTAEGLSIILVWGTNIPSSHVPWQKNKNQKKLLPSLGPQGAHVWPDGDLLNWSPVGHVDYL